MSNKTNSEKELLARIADLEKQIKVLKDRKKFGLVWEDKPEDVVLSCETHVPTLKEVKTRKLVTDNSLPTNILIEGDNYHSLSVLNYTHKGKIDVIYIDPPYNTGAKNWRYNNDYIDRDDSYRHSKWISLMYKRIALSKKLLKNDGVLICAIDENEQAHLNLLFEEMFPSHERHMITVVHNPRGIQGKNFSYTHEYAIFLIPKGQKIMGLKRRESLSKANLNLRDKGSDSERKNAKNCFYPFLVKDEKIIGIGKVPKKDFHPSQKVIKQKNGIFEIWPIDGNGIERKWRYAHQSVEKVMPILKVRVINENDFDIEIHKMHEKYKTVWDETSFNASLYGTKLLGEMLGKKEFDFPKSLPLVKECVGSIVKKRKSAIVLDFFAGSGTTGHAVLELNKEDGGDRKFILCTNNENKIAEEVTYERLKRVIKGYKNKKGEKVEGLGGNLSYYKTDLVDIEKLQRISDESKIKITYQAGEMIAIRENTLDETDKNEWWQIFENEERKTAIYFKEDKSKLLKLVTLLEKENKPTTLYIFGWGKNEYKNEYSTKNIKVEDIPEPIIEVYKEINRI